MFKPTANVLTRFSLFFAVITLAACGGSSDGGSDPVLGGGSDPEPVATGIKPGVYSTTISGDAKPQALTLVSSSGDYAIYANGLAGTFGTFSVRNEDGLSGNGKNIFLDETWQSTNGILSASADHSEKFTAAFTADGTEPVAGSDITGERLNSVSELPVTLNELHGTYSLSDASQTTTVTIDPDGTVNGSQTVTGSGPEEGCVITGSVTIPDPAYNIFEGDLSLTRCAGIEVASSEQRNGDYRIIGFLQLLQDGNKRLEFAGTNDEVIYLFRGDN